MRCRLSFYLFLVFVVALYCSKDSPTESENTPPSISSITANPSSVNTGEASTLKAIATDADGDNLTYTWNCDSGTLSPTTGDSVQWTAPDTPDTYSINCTVSDGKATVSDAVSIIVTTITVDDLVPDTWYDITPDKSLVYNDVYFLDSQQGWIAAKKHVVGTGHRGVVLITKDGGASWNEVVLSDAHDLEFVYFFNNVSGVGFALTDGIFKSNDGGLTWVYTPYYILALRGIEGSDENTLWGLRSWIGGTFFMKSLDQGNTWDEVESSRRDDDLHALFLSMSMPTPNCIYMAGHYDPNEDLNETIIHLIVCSYDNGATWEEKYLPQELIPARTYVHSIEFLTESYGWIGGEYRTMLHTIDGGTTWEQQNTGSGTDCFHDIDAIDEEHIIAVTSAGAILISRSGGEFWEESIPVDSLTSQFRKVQYLDSNIAYVIGRDVVLKAKISR